MHFVINILGIIFAAVLLALFTWLLSKPVGALLRLVNRQRAQFPTLVVVAETVLEYVPFVLSFATVSYICYQVYPLLGTPDNVKSPTEGIFFVSEAKVIAYYVLVCLVTAILAVVLPIIAYKSRTRIPTLWGIPLLCIVELFLIHMSIYSGFSLSSGDDSYLSISKQQIVIHHSSEIGFFYNKLPARDIIIPATQVETWSMKAKYSNSNENDDTVSSYTNLRIQYSMPDDTATHQESIDLSLYTSDDQFAIYDLMSQYYSFE